MKTAIKWFQIYALALFIGLIFALIACPEAFLQ
jgi:hypothetical protein